MCENLAIPKGRLKPANLQVGKGGLAPALAPTARLGYFSFKVTVRALQPDSFSLGHSSVLSDIPLR